MMEQTNRTILFERLNDQKDNLYSLIDDNDTRESLNDEEMKRIREKLEVGSFLDVIRQFDPRIYMNINSNEYKVECYRDNADVKDQHNKVVIRLCSEKSFLINILEMMSNKKKGKYVISSFQEYCNNLVPLKETKKFFSLREEIFTLCCDGDIYSAKKAFKRLISEYDDGFTLIRIFLGEVEKMLLTDTNIDSKKCFVINQKNSQVTPICSRGKFTFTNVVPTEKKKIFYNFINEIISEDEIINRNLIVLLLRMECGISEDNLSIYIKEYNKYMRLYKTALQKVWWCAKPVLETLMGIKCYFDQYDDTQGRMQPKMLIVNETLENANLTKNRNMLGLYLDSANNKNYFCDTIWYAILPKTPFGGKNRGNIRERFKSNESEYEGYVNDEQETLGILDLLGEYKVISFISACANEKSTFVEFSKTGMQQWENIFDFLDRANYKDYVVPCMPNFTLIPRAFTRTKVGYEVEHSDINKVTKVGDEVSIWFDDLNIEASYVAAGLISAYQCPDYLLRYFPKRTDISIPGVAYKLCLDENESATATTMFHEVITYTPEINKEVERRSHGMVFAPGIGRILAKTDRVYSFSNTNYNTIAMVQTAVFIERTIRHASQDFKENLIKEFFQERPGSLIAAWKKDKNNVNSIVKKGEDIKYTIDEQAGRCRLEIQFVENRRSDVVNINK